MSSEDHALRLGLSPRIRKSPYFEATLRWGATAFSTYNRMHLPFGYDTPENEFWRIVRDVTLWDVAAQRIVEITGPDALAFVERLTPRALDKCAPGRCRYVLITTPEGGIVNDPVLSRLGENHFWLSRADADLLLWAKGVAVGSGLDVLIEEPDVSPLQIQGPKSRPLITRLFGEQAGQLGYYHFIETDLGGIPLLVARTGWSAELGYELYLRDGARGEELWEAIMAAGRPFGIAPASPSRIRRIEAGILDYGVDMGLDTNPYEVGLARLVDHDKPADFIGRAALARIQREGVKRRLVGVEIDAAPLIGYNEERWTVRHAGARVGDLTSCIYSPRLHKNIGYVMVPVALGEPGTKLNVDSPRGDLSATVVPTPFFDPQKKLARG